MKHEFIIINSLTLELTCLESRDVQMLRNFIQSLFQIILIGHILNSQFAVILLM